MKYKYVSTINLNTEQSHPSIEKGQFLFHAAEATKGNACIYYDPHKCTPIQKFLLLNFTGENQLL